MLDEVVVVDATARALAGEATQPSRSVRNYHSWACVWAMYLGQVVQLLASPRRVIYKRAHALAEGTSTNNQNTPY